MSSMMGAVSLAWRQLLRENEDSARESGLFDLERIQAAYDNLQN